jgi:hypothetical protein
MLLHAEILGDQQHMISEDLIIDSPDVVRSALDVKQGRRDKKDIRRFSSIPRTPN